MKNSTFITSAIVAALGAGAAGAVDLGSSSYEAGVSLLMPENTGFMYTAQVDAQGLGAGSTAITTSASSFTLTGFAETGTNATLANPTADTTAGSGVFSDFSFTRTVTTNATSNGQGRVVATGEALGSIGGVGAASGKSAQQTIESIAATETVAAHDLVTNSTSSSESAASLVGGARTSLVAGVVGTADTFVGDTGTTVTDSQLGAAVAGARTAGNGTDITIVGDTTPANADLTALLAGDGVTGVTGTWGTPDLNLSVRNAGGGTVSLGVETGGFFTGGVSTLGKSGFTQASQ